MSMRNVVVPRRSRVLERLRAGKKCLCFKHNLGSPRAVEIAALAGFDSVWICQEHVPTDQSVMEYQIMAAKAHDVDCIVRVAKGPYSDYILPLEADASGIMIPHLMSADEARGIVRTVRFYPQGLRPVDGGNADGLYGGMDFLEYQRFANSQKLVIVQIEDPEPLAELDEICRIDGIDMIFFGPGDFSQAVGHPGEIDHPEVAGVRKLVAETAHKYGKFAGTVAGPDSMKATFDLGYDFVNCSADVAVLTGACRSIVNRFVTEVENA